MIDIETLRSVLSFDSETGVFVWLKHQGRCKAGDVAGCLDSKGYQRIRFNKKHYASHRLAWMYVYGVWPSQEIDHINGVKTDNRICNLRDVSRFVNAQNLKAIARRSHGLMGTRFNKGQGKWIAYISAHKKRHHLGTYPTMEEARNAYLIAKRRLHEESQP